MLSIRNDVQELQIQFSPFGYLDLQKACEIGDHVDLKEADIFEIIDEFKVSCGLEGYEEIDPVYTVLDHILQMARNHIDLIAGYDFMNDFSGN